jgi:hypothetical protein
MKVHEILIQLQLKAGSRGGFRGLADAPEPVVNVARR